MASPVRRNPAHIAFALCWGVVSVAVWIGILSWMLSSEAAARWFSFPGGFGIEQMGQLGDSFAPLTALAASVAAFFAWRTYVTQESQQQDEREHRSWERRRQETNELQAGVELFVQRFKAAWDKDAEERREPANAAGSFEVAFGAAALDFTATDSMSDTKVIQLVHDDLDRRYQGGGVNCAPAYIAALLTTLAVSVPQEIGEGMLETLGRSIAGQLSVAQLEILLISLLNPRDNSALVLADRLTMTSEALERIQAYERSEANKAGRRPDQETLRATQLRRLLDARRQFKRIEPTAF